MRSPLRHKPSGRAGAHPSFLQRNGRSADIPFCSRPSRCRLRRGTRAHPWLPPPTVSKLDSAVRPPGVAPARPRCDPGVVPMWVDPHGSRTGISPGSHWCLAGVSGGIQTIAFKPKDLLVLPRKGRGDESPVGSGADTWLGRRQECRPSCKKLRCARRAVFLIFALDFGCRSLSNQRQLVQASVEFRRPQLDFLAE